MNPENQNTEEDTDDSENQSGGKPGNTDTPNGGTQGNTDNPGNTDSSSKPGSPAATDNFYKVKGNLNGTDIKKLRDKISAGK